MSLFSHADLLREPQAKKKILTLSFSPIHFKFSLLSFLSFLLSHFLLSSPLFLISSLSLFPHPLLSSPPLSSSQQRRRRRWRAATASGIRRAAATPRTDPGAAAVPTRIRRPATLSPAGSSSPPLPSFPP